MTRSMALVAAVVSGALSVQAAFAQAALGQSATPLSEICGDCKVEKVTSCGAGKFLEGPNFDKDGVLWMVGLMAGEILKVSKDGQCTVANSCMTSEACRAPGDPRSVVHTSYVAAMHAMCPTAYAYSYDDAAGLHTCPSSTAFEVTFCP